MLRHEILLLHDNVPVHRVNVAQVALREAGFGKLPQSPHSTGLSPSDFYLFRYLKAHLKGKRFEDEQLSSTKLRAFWKVGLKTGIRLE